MAKKIFPLLLLALYATPSFAAQQTVTLSVPGMTCPVCPITVKKALEKVDGVKSVKIDFDTRLATVTFEDSMATADKLTKATANAGYPSTVANSAAATAAPAAKDAK